MVTKLLDILSLEEVVDAPVHRMHHIYIVSVGAHVLIKARILD